MKCHNWFLAWKTIGQNHNEGLPLQFSQAKKKLLLKIQSKQTIFEQKLQKQLNLYFGIHTITTEYIWLEIVIDTSPS